ncbi:MAG: PAS domain S-box protein [Kofleriaceae bacterium]
MGDDDQGQLRDLLRVVVDSSPDWIFVKDLEHRFLLVNEAFARAQKLAPEQMIGRRDTEFWSHELCEGDSAKSLRGFHHDDRDAFEGKPIRNPNDPATDADGTLRIFDTFKAPLRDPQGRVYGVLGFSRDVTELRRAESELRDSEERFRVFEQAAVGVALIDTSTGRFVRVNRKYAEILGYPRDAFSELDFMQITHPEDLAEDLASMERLRRGELRDFALEKRLLRSDGTLVWVALTVSATWQVGGTPTQHIAVIVDIGARRAAEQKSQQDRAGLESTLAALPDLMFDVDDAGRIYDFRAPDPQMLAVPPEMFLGRTLAEVLPPEAVANIDRAIAEAVTQRRSMGHRYSLEIGGSERWFELSIARKNVDAERPRLIAIARDITDRILAEQQRRSLETQLRQSQKMEAVGTLAGGIAHDFNNILTIIGLNLDAARDEMPQNHQASYAFEQIAKAAERATQLVRQILAFSRKQATRRVEIAPEDLVIDAIQLLRATLPAGVELTVSVASVPGIYGDPTQLQQVLINLGTNAWQAMERGVGTIGFTLQTVTIESGHPTLPPAEYVRIRIEDNGAGMAPATLERVFEPFFTTKEPGRGTGLGLSVAHSIVDDHDGALAITSELGRGTTCDVFLPTAAQPATQAPNGSLPSLATATHGLRVLYVDDEVALLRPTLRLLESLGYVATGLSHPRVALEAVRNDPRAFDIVMTDFRMPDLSGIDLAQEIVAIRSDLPIVLVTGFASCTEQQLRVSGIRHVLDKPFDRATLGEVLRSCSVEREPTKE